MRSIYFDYNATTSLDPQVRDAMLPYASEVFGNPSSIHHIGRRSRAALDDARERVARLFRCKPSEVVFTSGGTESNNLALFGVARRFRDRGRHIITSSIEHHAVLHACQYLEKKEGFDVTYLPVDSEGRVGIEQLAEALRPDTILVSIMAANNEVGTLQPVSEIGALCRAKGVLFHTDAVQWFGKEPFTDIHQFGADLVSLCAHKFHGPKGAGVLYSRSPLQIDPILFGGGHEQERRAGTENLPAIIGLAESVERFLTPPVFPREQLLPLSHQLIQGLSSLDGVLLHGSRNVRLSNTIAFSVAYSDSISLLAALDLEGICASSGSACSVGSLNPSHVLLAMGVPAALAYSFVRLSLGRDSTLEEVDFFFGRLPHILQRLQSAK